LSASLIGVVVGAAGGVQRAIVAEALADADSLALDAADDVAEPDPVEEQPARVTAPANAAVTKTLLRNILLLSGLEFVFHGIRPGSGKQQRAG